MSNPSKSAKSSLRSKICTSLSEPTVARLVAGLRGVAFAEVRLDGLRDADEDLSPLFEGKRRVIATCRPGRLEDRERFEVLRRAVDAGARIVDVELETPWRLRDTFVRDAKRGGVQVIVSSHNFKETPPLLELRAYLEVCCRVGADIAKIACRVRSPWDNATLLGLLCESGPAGVIGMGRLGLPMRLAAPLLGAEFTYASRDGARATAPGQLGFTETLKRMEALQRLWR